MVDSYDLTKLDPNSFEHLVNLLALRVLGAGHTGFGPGADGGRDGYYEGEAPYPSETERWSGRWYIQTKFHKPHLSKDPQKWLLERIEEEIKEFQKPDSKRKWPDNWIIATNIDPSGVPETGAFDKANELVKSARPKLENHFHIWGGSKILGLLNLHTEVSKIYGHFLTPGHVLTALYEQIRDKYAEIHTILYHLLVKQFSEQQYTKLEQAGSKDSRPGIHNLFIDLPFRANEYDVDGMIMNNLMRVSAKNHRVDSKQPVTKEWIRWRRYPSRARVWFVKGGPGQGKSTVGQYYCQIQRAALILQDNGLKVSAQTKTRASEVMEAAVAVDFWPAVPRIPISIELKDFAQWFGQRDKNKARGILTYLAERISASVEQEVLVGTLKRALQINGWFVTFDGLDEVPHDVKDEVAAEVRNFIDNVIVENNADVFTLCTSRPQGYSGQFSDIDGPTITLVNLSPEQALNCAKPVLQLDRSEEESKKYLQILTSAIASPSVRELMTTPLQSHIMAVVVRGGSKPPDRRWQLFTNFYEVIRSREANRDLPDIRLAKLLREDEQLLKTVHNRLGFMLHAKAEVSEGAQTNLDRDEFRGLVTDAVTQMVERNIEDTVEILMEATTERLVLVSTPDDGNHVRFDIRPLQEFFAAEYFYELVGTDVLRRRLDIAAGDSHWREVMHFLLSALVENKRVTEMVVAINVLEHLNEVDATPQIRLFNRRMGRGALLSARLLQEGVLEQDKRVRQPFRNCLEPLTAFVDTDALEPLLQVESENSQLWLINFLVDSLREYEPTENIGAAILLSYILPDDSDRVDEVKNFMLTASPDYITFLLAEREPRRYEEEFRHSIPSKQWFLEITLKILTHSDLHSIGMAGINHILTILQDSRGEWITAAEKIGLSGEHIGLLRIMIEQIAPEDRSQPQVCNFGVLTGGYYINDWTTKASDFDDLTEEYLDKCSSATGVLQLLFKLLRFAKSKGFAEFTNLLNDPHIHYLDVLPRHLSAYLPLRPYASFDRQIERLKLLDEQDFNLLLQGEDVGGVKYKRPVASLSFQPYTTCTLEQWKELLDESTDIAFHIWSDDFWRRYEPEASRPEIFNSPEGVSVLIDRLLESIVEISNFPNVWGTLIRLAPGRETEIRKAILTSVDRTPNPKSYRWGGKFEKFALNLPAEASLLPHIISSLIPNFESVVRNNEVPNVLAGINTSIREIVGDLNVLVDILNTPTLKEDVKAAALLMLVLSSYDQFSLINHNRDLIRYCPSKNPLWYVKALTSSIAFLAREKDTEAQFLIGSLFDILRGDYESRKVIHRLLSIWRERSSAPIQNTKSEELWLSNI